MDQTVAPSAVEEAAAPKRSAPLRRVAVRLGLLIAALVLLVFAAMAALGWWTNGRFFQSTNDAYLHADEVTVAPQVSGYVTKVLVDENQPVRAGQPLVQIDDRTYRATLDQQLATVSARQADIAAAQAQIGEQQATIDQRKAQLAGAQVNAAYSAREADRYGRLTALGVETAERLDQLRNSNDQARTGVVSDAAALRGAQRQTTTLQAQIGQAESQLKVAQAEVERSKINLGETMVQASIDGRVGDKSVRLGQFVQPGTRMMSIVPVQNVYVVANFKETQIGLMRRGQPVTIRIDALGGQRLHGSIESFAPGTGAQFALLPPENATGNFTKVVQRIPVRIRIQASPDIRSRLLAGLSATAVVDTRDARGERLR